MRPGDESDELLFSLSWLSTLFTDFRFFSFFSCFYLFVSSSFAAAPYIQMASLNVLGRGASVAMRSASAARPSLRGCATQQQQQRASSFRVAASSDAVSFFCPRATTIGSQGSSVVRHEPCPVLPSVSPQYDRTRSGCDIDKGGIGNKVHCRGPANGPCERVLI